MSPRFRLALGLFSIVVVLEATLPWWLWIDAGAYQWIQRHRSCDLAAWVQWIDPFVRVALAMLLVPAILGNVRGRLGLVFGVILAVAGGAIFCELLKTVIERARPNEPLGGQIGNSFPSGHVMVTVLAGIAAARLAEAAGWSHQWLRLAWVVALASICAQAVFRLLNGSHWVSDLPGSILLAWAWMLAVQGDRGRPATAWSFPGRVTRGHGWALVGSGALVAVAVGSGFRISLPSLLVPGPPAVARLDLAAPGALPPSEWALGFREPIGPVAWLRESLGAVSLRAGREAQEVRLVVRPPAGREAYPGCVQLQARINDWETPPVSLVAGWRELHFIPPEGVLRSGTNEITLRAAPDVHRDGVVPGRLALTDVRLTAAEP